MDNQQQQENLIYTDDLTGLFNRRYLYSQLPKELEDAQDTNRKVWLFMLDIDEFKMINDTHGHLSGDQLIKDLAAIIRENTKSEDKKIRYAGDEFTIIMFNLDKKDVSAVAERLVKKVDGWHFKERHSGKELHITISVGIAGFPHDTTDPTELINLADKALYVSKQKGKNCFSTVSEIKPELFWKKALFDKFPCPVFVDRDTELSILSDALAKASKGNASFVLVGGEAGIGKSRLLNEYERFLSSKTDVIRLWASCADKFITQPFYSLGVSLDSYLVGLNALSADLSDGLSDAEKASLASFMPSLKDIGSEDLPKEAAGEEKDYLSDALIKLLSNLSKKAPLCLVFDDLHYIDAQSLGVISRLVQENKPAPILIIGSFSESELSIPEIGDTALSGIMKTEGFQRHVQNIVLSGLDQVQTNEMISRIITDIPLKPDYSDIIYRRTRGNPLFIEELLKYFIEKELIYYKDGNWIQKEIDEVTLPASIEDAIKARIEDLDDETKEMIAKAAVIGENFQVDLLQRIDSEDRGYILGLVEAAKKVGLIYEKRIHGKDEFGFVTNEIRNILFKAIGGERTRHFYSRLGEVKEQLYPEKINSIAGELYYNFKKAEDQVRADQYAKIVKEGKSAFYDRTISYAQSLLEEVAQEKMLAPLSKRAWAIIPALVKNIYMASVNYMLYPPHNKMRTQSIEDIHKKLDDIFMDAEIFNLAAVGSNIIVNNKKIGKELVSFFTNSFISLLRNLNIESITFQKGIDLDEVTILAELLSNQQAQEENIQDALARRKVVHIQINEITYDISKKKSKEKESLQEIMLIDYLLGKLPSSEGGKQDLAATISTHAQEIAQALEQLGEQASDKTGKDKESAKAEIMAKSIQKIGREFLAKGEDWSKYKAGLAKTLLSMEPHLRANIISTQPEIPDAKDKDKNKGVDIMREISLDLPDEVIVEALTNQYLQKDTDIAKMKNMIQRFLVTKEKKNKLEPVLKEKLKNMGASEEECELMLDEHSWEKLSSADKFKKIIAWPPKVFVKMLPVIKILPLLRELADAGNAEHIQEFENKFRKLFEEKLITQDVFVSHLKEVMNLFMQSSPDKLLPQFIEGMVKLSNDKKEYAPIVFLVINPNLERIMQVFLKKKEHAQVLKDTMQFYSKDPQNSPFLAKIIDPVISRLVDEFVQKIDDNLDWAQILDSFLLFRDKAVGLLVNKALFETGVPEGKYFEAYLRKRTVGRILDHIPKEEIAILLPKERFSDPKLFVVKNLIDIIGGMESESAVMLLEIPLQNQDPGIRKKVVFALSKMKGRDSAYLLGKALKDADTNISSEALHALQTRKDNFAKGVLDKLA